MTVSEGEDRVTFPEFLKFSNLMNIKNIVPIVIKLN